MKRSVFSALLALILTLSVFAAVPMGASAATSGSFTYTVDENGLATITRYSGTDKVLTVPATLDGYPVYAIGSSALSKKSFEQVILSEGIRVLGNYSFEYNYSLTSITLPSTLTKIGTMSFNGCTELGEITIPKGVETMGTYVFWFSAVSRINVAADNAYFKSVDGVLYSKDGTTLYAYPPTMTGSYTVLDGTQTIATAAFMNSDIEAVTLPASVTTLGYQAFSGCGDLTSVTLATGPALINTQAFSKCEKLTELVIPEGCVELKNNIVADCKALKSLTLPASVTTLTDKTFRDAPTGLTVYTPAESVVSEAVSAAGLKLVLTDQVAADAVTEQIDTLGTVTSLSSEAQVKAARAAYDALTTEQKARVTNLDTLTAAEAVIAALKDAAAQVVAKIDALGDPILLSKENDVKDARKAYEVLSVEQKALVTNLDKLTAAESAIEALNVAVAGVRSKIDALGTITSITQEPDVTAAREAYDALPADSKRFVSNLTTLEEAEAAIAAIKKPANDVVRLISQLGAITSTEQKPQVEAARAAYDALDDEVKPLVVNYALLVSAEEIIAALEQGEVNPGYLLGDVDSSGVLDVADILKMKAMIMSEEHDEQLIKIGDIDASGSVDVADIISLKNIIMVG